MNKREMLHVLIDKLLDIEETTRRGIDFEYSTHLGVSFNVTSSPKNYTDRIRPIYRDYHVKDDALENTENAEHEIDLINETPDKEPVFSFSLPESRAKELGLIA
jgi:hypothetical protein